MKTRVFALLTVIALTIAVISCSDKNSKTGQGGKTYHVSVTGIDTNDGSETKPFKTIMSALDQQ